MHTKNVVFALTGMIVGCLSFHTAEAEQSTSVLGRGIGANCASAAAAVVAGNAATDQGVLECNVALRSSALSDRERAAVYLNLGVLHEGSANHAAAITDDNAALFYAPALTEAYINRGVANASLHRFGDAVADFTHAIALDPAKPELVYFNRALAYEDKGDLKAAYRDYQTASRLAPGWAAPAAQLARFTVVRRQAMG